jgi:glyoxylase-like metal-dependent hydrolase (beta-lactamase superfamily II)
VSILSRRRFLSAGVQALGAASLASFASNAQASRAARITASELAPGMTLLDGAGCNVIALRGPDGSLLIDGGYARNSKALLKAAANATGNRHVSTLINTHWHPAQTGSNEAIGRDGGLIISHERTRVYLGRAVASVDYEGLYGPLPEKARPTKTTRNSGSLEFGGRHIDYGYLPAAHTDGDLYIHVPELNLLAAGGPVSAESWPLLDFRNGGWLGGLVKAHEKLAALVKPDTRIIPANGRSLTGADIARHHEMYLKLHEQLVDYMNKGFGASDAIAERPLKDHEAELGDPTEFLKGAYRSLILAYSPD